MVLLSDSYTSAPATETRTPSAPVSPRERAARLSARRALIVARFAALYITRRQHFPEHSTRDIPAGHDTAPESTPAFTPAARSPILGADAEPILSPAERARLSLDVALSRDHTEWQIGRAAPCGWLLVVGVVSVEGVENVETVE